MSEEKNRLRIHAQITPETPVQPAEPDGKRHRFRPNTGKPREKLTFSDRLLRNSALACALLLAILAMGNINQPWARSASESIERALTMHIDLDESIGGLTFVRNLMPESALVFLNLSGEKELAVPVDGALVHEYSDAQPWLMFECTDGSEVVAVADGTVTAVSELSGETVGILIDHGNGRESVYAYLSKAIVEPGDVIQRGQAVGISEINVYFELRESEAAVNPTQLMGL